MKNICKLIAIIFLFSITSLKSDICVADVASPEYIREHNRRMNTFKSLETRVISDKEKEIVSKGKTTVELDIEEAIGILQPRPYGVAWVIARPLRFLFAVRFPGPCKFSLTFKDSVSGETILEENKLLTNMFFIPLKRCIKGRSSQKSVEKVMLDAKNDKVSIDMLIARLNSSISEEHKEPAQSNISHTKKSPQMTQISILNSYDIISETSIDEDTSDKCFYYENLYDFRETFGEINDRRFEDKDSEFTLLLNLNVELFGYDMSKSGPIPNTLKNKTENLTYKIHKNKTVLTFYQIDNNDNSTKEIRKIDIKSSYPWEGGMIPMRMRIDSQPQTDRNIHIISVGK